MQVEGSVDSVKPKKKRVRKPKPSKSVDPENKELD